MHKHTKTGKKSLQTQIPKQRHDKAKTTLAASTGTRLFWPHAMFLAKSWLKRAPKPPKPHATKAICQCGTGHTRTQNGPYRSAKRPVSARKASLRVAQKAHKRAENIDLQPLTIAHSFWRFSAKSADRPRKRENRTAKTQLHKVQPTHRSNAQARAAKTATDSQTAPAHIN